MFAKRPGASVLAVVALGLGIGLTTTMFSIVQGAILRGLPFEESERILGLSVVVPSSPGRGDRLRLHDFSDLRVRQQSFESIEGFTNATYTAVSSGAYPERVRAALITPGMFRTLRVVPIIGRDFTDADAAAGAPSVVIIGHQIWQTRFESRADVVGQVITLSGTPTTVIGVMEPKFRFPESQDIWLPYTITLPTQRDQGSSLATVARLRDGVSEAQAATELAGISSVLAGQYPEENKNIRLQAMPYIRQFLGQDVISTLFTMLGAVLGVMLIACVNVTNLQLARAADRMKEMAVRTALGSGRWRIIRQLLTEGLLLAMLGAVVGLGLAQVGVTFFSQAIVDTNPPFWIDVRLDLTVLLFVTFITGLAAIVASLVPGWRVARADVNTGLKDDGRGTTSLKMGRFSRSLIIVEVMVSCLLLIVSGLMIRNIIATSRVEYPFPTRNVFYGQISLDTTAYPENTQVFVGHQRVQDAVTRTAGVSAVALTTGYPRPGGGAAVAIEGQTYDSPDAFPRAGTLRGTPSMFDVFRAPPLIGRTFRDSDSEGRQPVAVVDQSFARRHFGEESPIGRRLRFGTATEGPNVGPWIEIVGVVRSLAEGSRPGQIQEVVYLPLAQSPVRSLTMLAALRATDVDPRTLTSDIRKALLSVHETIPLMSANSLAGELWRQGWAIRLFGGLFLMFGCAALVLAAVGLYGVMAFNVHQRTPEIGVRMAIGADRSMVLRMILKQGLWRVGIGIVLGLVPGWFVAGLMGGLLQGVPALDPVVYGATILTLFGAGTLACLVPALRAASISPVSALRGE
jgi:predicted permease